jgi:hypothetical protein
MVIPLRKPQGKPFATGVTKPRSIAAFEFRTLARLAGIYDPFIAKLKPPFKFDRP